LIDQREVELTDETVFASKTQGNVEDYVFIVDIYRGLLGRDPDEVGMQGFGTVLRNGSLDRVGLIKAILTSDEYRRRLSESVQQPSKEPQGCWRSEKEAVFASFQKHHGVGRPGFIANFLGGLTDVRFIPGIDSLSGFVEGYPIPGNFRGDTLNGSAHSGPRSMRAAPLPCSNLAQAGRRGA
jgi:Domain of unknown function (DUF4214)